MDWFFDHWALVLGYVLAAYLAAEIQVFALEEQFPGNWRSWTSFEWGYLLLIAMLWWLFASLAIGARLAGLSRPWRSRLWRRVRRAWGR